MRNWRKDRPRISNGGRQGRDIKVPALPAIKSLIGEMKEESQKELDMLATNLQDKILADAARDYSKTVRDHFSNPRNVGVIPGTQTYAMVTGVCGDTMEIFLSIDDDIIQRATFNTDGCIATIACGSIITEMVKDKTVSEAMQISAHQIIRNLNGLPDNDKHCALLAVSTLYSALGRYFLLKREE